MTLTIASIVKNEADRFLPRALACWAEIADRIVVLDNGSTDGTTDLLNEAGCEWSKLAVPMDGSEWLARKALWDKAVPGSEWIVHLDADHSVAGDFRPHLTGKKVGFRVYDMWSPTEYRSDAWWQGHARPWWLALNVADEQDRAWTWNKRGWHSGHVPSDTSFMGKATEIPRECSILHYGYATPELRKRHYAAYVARSGVLKPDEVFHASTIVDECPRVEELPFTPTWTLL